MPWNGNYQVGAYDDGRPNGTLTRAWSKVSGPGEVIFGDTSEGYTSVSFRKPGAYVLQFAASDSELVTTRTFAIQVFDPGDQGALLTAGCDFTTIAGEPTVLPGLIDDDQPWAALNVGWKVLAGPGTVAFTDAAQPDTTATFNLPGVYRLALTATDSTGPRSDEVFVTVQPPPDANQPPVTPPPSAANVAPYARYRPITYPMAGGPTTLRVVISDDCHPDNKGLSAQWQLLYAPGTVTLGQQTWTPLPGGNVTELLTEATFSQPGNCNLRLTVSDGSLAAVYDFLVSVLPPVTPNAPPLANAGPDQTVATSAWFDLSGTVSDDGLPAGGALSASWSLASGPGPAYFHEPAATNTQAQVHVPGVYVFRLSAKDGQQTASDDITITAVAPANQPPFVSAGNDFSVTRPHAGSLQGLASDDGLPAGYPLVAEWSQVAGPAGVVFAARTNAVTSATFPTAGAYMLRLTAFDGQITSTDDVTVTVVEGTNAPPVVNAGADFAALVNTPAALPGTVTDDGLPNGYLQSSWSQVSGPGAARVTTLNGAYRVTADTAGAYVLRLTSSDGVLSASDDVTVTVHASVPPPVVAITAPLDAAEVTAPTLVLGTATSPLLASWALEWRLKPSDADLNSQLPTLNWLPLSTATTNVVNNTLGLLDPTLSLNGLYELRLTATDQIGRSASTEPVTVVFDRNMKIGHFAFSFNDLTLPVAGIPITITRSYDSRNKQPGDFGIGWTLDIANIRVQKNRNLGRNWQQTSTGGDFPVYAVETARPRMVTITFPNGKVYKFGVVPEPAAQFAFPISYPRMTFVPLPGTFGTLTPVFLHHQSGERVVDDWTIFPTPIPGTGDLISYELLIDPPPGPADNILWNPALFEFTTQEGYTYLLSETNGLHIVTDPNGNTLTITTNGIIHSSGKNVVFQRDDLGRITNIVDAAGQAMRYAYDAAGNLAAFTDRDGNVTTFTYDGSHNLLTLTNPEGVMGLTNEYDPNGRLIRNTDALGYAVNYGHDIEGRREYITNRLGDVIVEEYDEHGNVVRFTNPLDAVTLSTYDSFDNLLSRVDPLGRTNIYTYDDLGNRTSVRRPSGATFVWSHNSVGNILTYADAQGNITTNTYDANGNLISAHDSLGGLTQFTHDSRGKVVSQTDPFGHVTTFQYDAFGNLTNEVDALGNRTSYTVDENGRLLSIRRPRTIGGQVSAQSSSRSSKTRLGKFSKSKLTGPSAAAQTAVQEEIVIHLTYTAAGQPLITLWPDGSTTRRSYGGTGHPLEIQDQNGQKTTFAYDDLGRLTSRTDAKGNQTQYDYDAAGRLARLRDPLGRATVFTYNATGNVVGVTYPDGTTIGAAYNLAGELLRETNRLGQVTTYVYDNDGNRISATDHLGLTTTFTYNAKGAATSIMDRLGRTTEFEFDALNRNTLVRNADGTTRSFAYAGRLVTSITDEAGQLTHFGYDAVGRLTSVTNRIGEVTRTVYDEVGNRIGQIDPLGQITAHEYDSLGRPIRTILPDQGTIQRQFDPTGRLLSVTDQNGQTTTAQYNSIGQLVSLTDPLGQMTRLNHDAAGQVIFIVDPAGRTNFFEYNAAGQRTARVYPDGSREAIMYDAFGRPVAFVNQASNVTQLAYDFRSRIGHVTAPDGQTTSYGYDAEDQLTSITDANGRTTQFAYDLRGRRTHVFHPDGTSTVTGYDVLGRAVAQTDGAGNTRQFAYNAQGRLISTFDALNQSTSFGYDAAGRITSVLDALNRTTTYTYDAVGRLTGVMQPDGSTSSRQYDTRGLVTAETDPNGNITRYGHDALSRLVAVTNALNQVTQYTYDSLGRLTALTDAARRTTSYGYDSLGRLASTTYPDGGVFTSTYDARGLPTSSVDSLGNLTFYGYDTAGRLTSVTNALGHVTAYGYDPVGRLLSVTNANLQVTSNTYDVMGRLTAVTFPDGRSNLFFYDNNGWRVAETDQAGQSKWLGYDAEGRLTSVTNALGQVTRYAYDALGHLISATDANSNTTLYAYDPLGRRTRRTLPGGQFEQFGYDANGNLTSHTNFNGFTTTYGYDALNRLLQRVPDPVQGQPPVRYTYTTAGARASMTDATGVTTYTYDAVDRLLQKSVTWNNATGGTDSFTAVLAYTYDLNGNRLRTLSSNTNGTDIAYEYDALNRLSAVNDSRLGRTAYGYDPVGNLIGSGYPNQLTNQFAYDGLNRLTNVTVLNAQAQVVQSFAYTLGAAGHRLGVTEASGRGTRYGYDAVYRLTSESVTNDPFGLNGTVTYQYDPVGNRFSRQSSLVPLPSANHAFNVNDRLTSDTYDANGNTLLAPNFGLQAPDQYDFENRLIQRLTTLNNQPSTINLQHDGDGNRVSKTVGGVTTHYLVDDLNPTGYAQVLEELTTFNAQLSPPTVTRLYTHGHGLISQDQVVTVGGTPQWQARVYGRDGLGSTRFLSDLNGQVTDTYAYDAFGNLLSQGAVSAPTPNAHLFRGESYDADLGLYYLRARYANPASGRFWTADRFEGYLDDPASRHLYAFNQNDPVNRIDPSGHYSLGESMAVSSLAPLVRGMVDQLMTGLNQFSHGLAGGEELKATSEEEALFIDSLAQGAGVNLGRNNFYQTRLGAPFLLSWNQPYAQYPSPCGTFAVVSAGGDFRLMGCGAKYPVFQFQESELLRELTDVGSGSLVGATLRGLAKDFRQIGGSGGGVNAFFNYALADVLDMGSRASGAAGSSVLVATDVGMTYYGIGGEEYRGHSSLFRGIYEEPERADEIIGQTAHGFVRAGLGASTLGLSEVGFAVVEAVDSGDFTQLQDASLGMLTLNAAIKARADPPNVHPRARPQRQALEEPKSVGRQGSEPCPKAKVMDEGRPPHEGGEFLDDSHVNTFDEPRPPAGAEGGWVRTSAGWKKSYGPAQTKGSYYENYDQINWGAAKTVANPVPSTMARVIPEGIPATTLGRPGAADVFVTAADDIAGMNASQIANRLGIPQSPTGFRVFEFPTPQSGVASPVFRTDPGFIGGGRTIGGAREFVIPNGSIPPGTVRTVP